MRVDVISPVQKNRNNKPFQSLAVYFQGKRLPVESEMFLRNEAEALPEGEYVVDLEKVVMPDRENFNRPTVRIAPDTMVPVRKAAPVAALK